MSLLDDDDDSPAAGTFKIPSIRQHQELEAVFRLVVVEGPEKDAAFVIDGTEPAAVLVGQSPSCAIRVSDVQVSRRHAALDVVGTRLRIRDLGSTNGTTVDGVAIVEANLRGDEIVRIGSTAIRVERGATAVRSTEQAAPTGFGRFLGVSPEMRRLYPLCTRLAASDVPVVIEGETGTGKEVLAEALHEMGPRASEPFVVFDCTTVPANLLESELFGHERGAFTGALTTRKGLFEQAHGGTLLIDEIGDLDLALQPKLLRALERSEVRRVGGDRWIRADVRVIAATRRDLDREVQEGRFRDDLFHRLAVARIELPPLRRRSGDVFLLSAHFAEQLGATPQWMTKGLLSQWEASPWPGNVRELRNAVARRISLGDALDPIVDVPISSAAPEAMPAEADDVVDRILALDLPLVKARQKLNLEFERRYVERLLEQHGGSVARAAAASGIARRHFQRLRARGRR